jgi:membrane-associated two-gene conflict system component 1 (EACC1)
LPWAHDTGYGRLAMTEVRLHVVGYPDSDDEERADLAARLREELRERGIDDVSHPAADPPPGAKGGALEWAQLVVTLAGTVPSLALAIQGWVGRHPNAAVTLEIDGDRLTLDEASPADRQRLLETFLARHDGR